MVRKTQVKRVIARKAPEGPEETASNLISKYLLPFATVIVSAMFYFSGWVYIAHWYGFFGIDATYLNIPIQIILLHGLPGILVLGFGIVLSMLSLTLFQRLVAQILGKEKSELEPIEFHDIIFVAQYSTLFLAMFIFGVLRYQVLTYSSLELDISIAGLVAVGVIKLLKSFETPQKTSPSRFRSISAQAVLFIPYFFVSIATSAMLGEWDASRGGRLMVGDWQIPEITLHSTASIPSLSKKERKLDDREFEYSSLGLLASNDRTYFLVDSKITDYYKTKPNVYIIPRSDNLTLNFIVSPYLPQTPSPIPTITSAPTLTPAVTITQTP